MGPDIQSAKAGNDRRETSSPRFRRSSAMAMRGLSGLRSSPSFPSLEVWLADLDAQLSDVEDSLDPAERMRAERFVFEEDRRRYVAAHRVLRHLLARRTGITEDALRIKTSAFGKPYLLDQPGCAFNLSHSGAVALIGFADDGEIGVDVEVLRSTPDLDSLVRLHFSAGEREAMEATSRESRDMAFLLGWTRKEACLKAIGVGLNVAPESVDAGVTAAERSVRIETAEVEATVVVQSLVYDGHAICAVARRAC